MRLDDLTSVRLADVLEAQANVDLYAAAPASLGVKTQSIAGATLLMAPRIGDSYFNRVIGLGLELAATRADLEAVLSAYRSEGVDKFWIHLSPAAQPVELQSWLEQRGFVQPPRRSWAKFMRDTHSPPSIRTELEIRAATIADVAVIADIVCSGFGMPRFMAPWFAALAGRPQWEFFVATAGGIPIAAAAVFFARQGAWLGVAATRSEFRKQGAQSALLSARIKAAAARGCSVVATETGDPVGEEPNPSLANIQRCGFHKVASRLNYAASAKQDS